MERYYYAISWDTRCKDGRIRHFSRTEDNGEVAVAFAIAKQRKAKNLERLSVRHMMENPDAPYIDERGGYHRGGCHKVSLLRRILTYEKR